MEGGQLVNSKFEYTSVPNLGECEGIMCEVVVKTHDFDDIDQCYPMEPIELKYERMTNNG